MANRQTNTHISVPASDFLKGYLKETLDLETAKRLSTEPGNKLSKTDRRRLVRNNKKKLRILKRLFESLANLVYFFEFIDLHREVVDVFDDDVHDLLGLKGAGPRNPKGEGIIRLLHSIMSEGSELTTNENIKFNYRRRMAKVMQYIVNQKAKAIVMTSKNDPLRYDDIQFSKMIFSDLDRAQVWMNYLDRLTLYEEKKANRVLGD